ncbi:MAG: hypothetical protein GKS06_08140 [Acidobacteria bacterium]|nr:hypothetical protein [Acidobacteriota bacterium]
MNGRDGGIVESAYRLVLYLYPRSFRRRNGDAMIESLRDRLADPRYRGCNRLRLLGLLIEDTWSAVWRERRGAQGSGRGGWREDVRFGLKLLYRDKVTTGVATVALALGTGLSTVAFAVVYGTVLRGLPFDHAEQLVHFERANRAEGFDSLAVTPP